MSSFSSIGDLTRPHQLRLGQYTLKAKLNRLTQEVTTGIKSDIAKAVGGDLSEISHIDSRLKILTTLQQNASEAGIRLEAMQLALGQVQSLTDDLGPKLLVEAENLEPSDLILRAQDVEQSLRQVFNALNGNVGGHYVFSGTRNDRAPLGGFETMLSELKTAVAGATTAADITKKIDAWFDAPAGQGGFTDLIYQGADAKGQQVPISSEHHTGSRLTANSPELRDALKGMAIMAYIASAGQTIDATNLRELFTEAGGLLIKATTGLTSARAELGQQQARVTQAQARNAAEVTSFSIARNALIGADPFEAATALKETEASIESLYILTNRLSRLSLTEHLS